MVELQTTMVPSPDVAEIRSNERLSGKSRSPNVQQDCPGHVREYILTQEGAFEDAHEAAGEHEQEEESEELEDRNRVISVSQRIERLHVDLSVLTTVIRTNLVPLLRQRVKPGQMLNLPSFKYTTMHRTLRSKL